LPKLGVAGKAQQATIGGMNRNILNRNIGFIFLGVVVIGLALRLLGVNMQQPAPLWLVLMVLACLVVIIHLLEKVSDVISKVDEGVYKLCYFDRKPFLGGWEFEAPEWHPRRNQIETEGTKQD
jgi:hypothetical protein